MQQKSVFKESSPDAFHLNAATGWLLLQNPSEAEAEFKKLSQPYPSHPQYLRVKCRLLIAQKRWPEALQVSRQQLRLSPAHSQGWVDLAYCLHELQRTDEAYFTLRAASQKFPRNSVVTFNLACYCCHLKRYDDALNWVNRTADLIAPSSAVPLNLLQSPPPRVSSTL